LRLEGAGLGYRGTAVNDFDVSILDSATLTGEYCLSSDVLRPFIGAGVGFSRRSSLDVSSGSAQFTVPSASKFGFFPEIVVEAGHFRLSADYNVLPDKGGYLAFKIGFFLGGGKK